MKDGTKASTPEDICNLLSTQIKPNGWIDNIYIDYEGVFIPIMHENELRLTSALVMAWERSCNEARLNVSCSNPIP